MLFMAIVLTAVISAKADVGDHITTKTVEGVNMTFTISSETAKICYVSPNCIDPSTEGVVTIPEKVLGLYTVTSIGVEAFLNCEKITEVVIPQTVTIINNNAFQNCTGLKRLWLPEGVTKIPSNMCEDCYSLEDVYVPNGVTSIEYAAFSGCSSLSEFQFPPSLRTIGQYAFFGCTSLYNLYFLGENAPEMNDYCFNELPHTDWGYGETSDVVIYVPESSKEAYEEKLQYRIPYFMNAQALQYVGPLSIRTRELGYMAYVSPYINKDESMAGWDFNKFDENVGEDMAVFNMPSTLLGMPVKGISGMGTAKSVLTRVNLPNTIERISEYTFYNCTGLSEVNVPEGVEFVGCYAFRGTALQELRLPTTLKTYGLGLVTDCTQLSDVYLPVYKVDAYAYEGDVSASSATLHVPFGTKEYYSSGQWKNEYANVVESDPQDGDIFLAEYKTGSTMRFQVMSASEKTCRVHGYGEDGNGKACIDNTTGGSVNIPQKPMGFTVVELGSGAFHGCDKLVYVGIPSTVKTIEQQAFINCEELVSVGMPTNLTTIASAAFMGCKKLAGVNLPEGLVSIKGSAFYHCSSLESVEFPSTLKELGRTAFSYSGINAVNGIPASIKSIETMTFAYCEKLESVELPSSVSNIGYCAFKSCPNLNSVTLHNCKTLLGNYADVTSEDNDNDAFAGIAANAVLHVHANAADYYGKAPWTTWFSSIQGDMPTVATGIMDINRETITNNRYYNLIGQHVENPTKGLYIVNGRKVIVK